MKKRSTKQAASTRVATDRDYATQQFGRSFSGSKRADMSKNFSDSLVNDFVDTSDDTASGAQSVHQEQMSDQASETDKDNRKPDTSSENPGASNNTEYQAHVKGFNREQKPNSIIATVAIAKNRRGRSLVSSRVFIKPPTGKVVRGSILAVGKMEFAVVWDDDTVSVEPKGEYVVRQIK